MPMLHQEVQIQTYHQQNQQAIDQFMNRCWPHDPDTIAYYAIGAKSALTLCAWHQDQLVGIGSLWDNRIHPQHCYFGIHLHPLYQQAGIDDMLYAQLIAQTAIIKGRILQTATWSHAHNSLDFLHAHGFQPIKQTYLGELSLPAIIIPSLAQPILPQPQFAFYSFQEYLSNYPIEPLLTIAHASYQATHTYNLANSALSEWQIPFLTDIHEAASFVLCHQQQIVGFNWIYQAASHTLEQGLLGVDHAYNPYQSWIIRSLFQKTLQIAHQNNYQTLRYEIDSIDPWAMELVTFLPIVTQPSWVTLCLPHSTQ